MHSVSSFEYASVCTCCRSLKWEHDPAVENLGRIVVSTKGDFQRIQGGTENCWSPQPSAPKAQRPVPAALLWLCVCVPGTLGQAAQSLWTCFSSVLWVCCLRQWKIKLCSYVMAFLLTENLHWLLFGMFAQNHHLRILSFGYYIILVFLSRQKQLAQIQLTRRPTLASLFSRESSHLILTRPCELGIVILTKT